jgi:hypothetical protein
MAFYAQIAISLRTQTPGPCCAGFGDERKPGEALGAPGVQVQVISLVVSALLGLAFSLLARTESRIYLIGSAYLVLLVLLSGLIAKIDPSEKILSLISNVFPLGYAMDMLSDWMFFGLVPNVGHNTTQIMFALLILSIVVVYGSVLYFKRAI